MAEFFGDLERLAADLYPYRWPILLGVVAVLAAIAAYGYRRRWHMAVWERRRLAIIVGTPLLVVAGFLTWGFGVASLHQQDRRGGVPLRLLSRRAY